MMTGRVLVINLYPTNTILDLKNKIAVLINLPPNHQKLVYCGRMLLDNVILCDFDNNCTIQLIESELFGDPLITIMYNVGNYYLKFTDFKCTDTVEQLKVGIYNKTHVPIPNQLLIYAGKILKNTDKIFDMPTHATVRLVSNHY